jgi:hypothetical protein
MELTLIQIAKLRDLNCPVLSAHSTELLKSLPRVLSPYQNDAQALVNLGLAISIRHEKFTSFKRTDKGTAYLKLIGQY